MDKVYKKARAKVNLTLNVLEKREDGYHNLETVFQKVSLYDEIYVSKNDFDDIRISTNIASLEGEDNIIFKAYKKLKDMKNIGGVDVRLKKNIPMQAGLAGGSTDCACFIECVDKLFSLNLSRQEMIDVGAELGADVPQAFFDTPVIARGIGEKIEEFVSNARYYIVIIKPKFTCNTKEMYKKIDEDKDIIQEYNTENMKKSLEEGNIIKIAENLYNIFEAEVDDADIVKRELIDVGAVGSLMAGSGSTFFGIFEDKEKAKKAYMDLKKKYDTFYCLSVQKHKNK